jgi:hypothetical protein
MGGVWHERKGTSFHAFFKEQIDVS